MEDKLKVLCDGVDLEKLKDLYAAICKGVEHEECPFHGGKLSDANLGTLTEARDALKEYLKNREATEC